VEHGLLAAAVALLLQLLHRRQTAEALKLEG